MYDKQGGVDVTGANSALVMAIRVSDRYGGSIPTSNELIRDFGMHRATAFRWIRAFKDARGIPVSEKKKTGNDTIARAREMRKAGCKLDYIAAVLGICEATARKITKGGV